MTVNDASQQVRYWRCKDLPPKSEDHVCQMDKCVTLANYLITVTWFGEDWKLVACRKHTYDLYVQSRENG